MTRHEEHRAIRAFQHVADQEDSLNRIAGALRTFLMLDLGDVIPDADDQRAILELVYGAQEALERVWAKRSAAWDELHPFAYPQMREVAA